MSGVVINRTNDPTVLLGRNSGAVLVARQERSDASLVSIHVAYDPEDPEGADEALGGLAYALLDVLLAIRKEERERGERGEG